MAADILDFKEKKLERLSPHQLTSTLMRLPAKKRLETILDRADSEAVVAALDPNDFFFTVQEIGPDDALPVLALGSVEQINHLFDIEWWKKDSIDPARALTWLDRLGRASGRKLLEWIYKADFELLTALFKQWISVDVAPEDIDIVEARESLPPRTLDDHYFWEARYPQFDELILQLLTLIYDVNYSFFRELMNHVIYAPTLEIDEIAYGFHKGRLEDHYIPDYYDSLEIYRALKPEELLLKQPLSTKSEKQLSPSFALALLPEGVLLERALRRISNPAMIDTLQLEMASLSNKVIVADQLPFDSAEALRGAVEKALAYVNLGLELLSGGEEETAKVRVQEVFIEHLFRLAQAEVASIRGRMQKLIKFGWVGQCPGKTRCLDGIWFDRAEELLGKTPKIIREDASAGTGREDLFRSVQDLALAKHHVAVIATAGHLYSALKVDSNAVEPLLWAEAQVNSIQDVTLGVMVLTAAARSLHTGEWKVEPLPTSDWATIFPLLQPDAIENTVSDWVQRTVPDPGKRAMAEEYLSPILRDFATEMETFSGKEVPEARLFPFLMFQADLNS